MKHVRISSNLTMTNKYFLLSPFLFCLSFFRTVAFFCKERKEGRREGREERERERANILEIDFFFLILCHFPLYLFCCPSVVSMATLEGRSL